MTYCVGIKVKDGLVCLADGRVTSGSQVSNARKLSRHGPADAEFTVMTSGLRSLRDKTLAYLDRDQAKAQPSGFDSLMDAVHAYGVCLRRVHEEDAEALDRSDLRFNLHAIIAGQLPDDPEPTIFLVYPEGNWIEVDRRTPYVSIGATTYGKPILDRALRDDTPIDVALKLAYLSFDSTRFSSADVGFPIDLVTFLAKEKVWREAQYDYDDLMTQREWWNQHITQLAAEMPDGPWIGELLPRDEDSRSPLFVVRGEER
jgi:putative proteasome-type protease